MKKIYGVCTPGIAVGIIGIIMLGLLLAGSAEAATFTVCKSGCLYSSIQDAVNASSVGDTIQVQNGTYYENVNVTKQLTLHSIGMPVVVAGGGESAITLSANGVRLEGFTVIGTRHAVGIKVTSNNNMLSGNNASYGYTGIYLRDFSNNNTLIDNNASNNYMGIALESSSNNTLSDNNASNNEFGIWLSSSTNNTLSGSNVSSNSAGDIHLGHSSNNMISSNNISNNSGSTGLIYSSNNIFSGNNVSNNEFGINLWASNNNTLSSNNFSNNNNYGIALWYYSSNNNIYNNFFNNINNIIMDAGYSHIWNVTRTSGINIIGGPYIGGNAWANLNGTGFSETCKDADDDGICDSPYKFDSNNTDYLPLAYKPLNILKGDINNNGESADAGDLVLMKRASIDGMQADSRYDLNNNGLFADAGDMILMKRASIGEINL